MSNTGSRAGSADALSSLLTDLPGVEGNIFSRPKTLGGMKKVQQTPVNAQTSVTTLKKPSSDASFPTSGRPPSYPSPTKPAIYESTPSESHSIADLENMLDGSTPNKAASPSQMNSTAQYEPSTAVTPSFDDPFADFVSSPPIASQPTVTASTPLSSQIGATSSIPVDEDPLDMFGGTPAPSMSHRDISNTSHNHSTNDFFADFLEAPTTAAAPAVPVVHQASTHSIPPSPGINIYSEVDLAEDTISKNHHVAQTSPPPPLQTTTSLGSGHNSSFKDRISEQPASTKAPHKAFQFLDAKQGSGGSTSHLGGTSSYDDEYSTSAPVPPSSAPNHGGSHGPSSIITPTTETVVEIGHRAAKALQIGTKWFMKASKQLATEVQSKIEKHRQHFNDHSTSNSNTTGGMTTSHSFYFDWASQIVRMSPGTRAAAMGAMQEDDRLEVQKIIDEAELGEVMLNSVSTRDGVVDTSGSGPLEQGRRKISTDWTSSDDEERQQQQQKEREQRRAEEGVQPPPSYDELMGSAPLTGDRNNISGAFTAASLPKAVAREQKEAEDVLGVTSTTATSVGVSVEDDLLRMDGGDTSDNNNTSVNGGTGHIDDLFTVQKPKAAAATRPVSTATASTSSAGRCSGGLSSMIDLGDSLPEVDTTGHSELYVEKDSGIHGGSSGDPNEPEIRKVLREKRIAEKHERMKQQLAEKRAREEAEDAEKAGKVAFRDTLKPKIDAWSANKKDNIRALLSTVHTVLWEDSGWTAPSIADMVDPGKVKKWYMKANLVVHPDKVKQKGGTLEQVATADMVFDVLKGAWGKFEASK